MHDIYWIIRWSGASWSQKSQKSMGEQCTEVLSVDGWRIQMGLVGPHILHPYGWPSSVRMTGIGKYPEASIDIGQRKFFHKRIGPLWNSVCHAFWHLQLVLMVSVSVPTTTSKSQYPLSPPNLKVFVLRVKTSISTVTARVYSNDRNRHSFLGPCMCRSPILPRCSFLLLLLVSFNSSRSSWFLITEVPFSFGLRLDDYYTLHTNVGNISNVWY